MINEWPECSFFQPQNKPSPHPYADFQRQTDIELTKNLQDYNQNLKQWFCDQVKRDAHPLRVQQAYSDSVDSVVRFLFDQALCETKVSQSSSFCLCALGGYGRKEMSLYSDVDLVLICSDDLQKQAEPLFEKILYPLWDLQLDLGHASHTLSSFIQNLKNDHTTLTAALDIRLIAGSEDFFKIIQNRLSSFLKNKVVRKKWIIEKIAERKNRLKKFGGSHSVLEPNVKECEGGLRDFHMIRWFFQFLYRIDFETAQKKELLPESLMQKLELGHLFLSDVRNQIHCLKHKKLDQLRYDIQLDLAAVYHLEDDETSRGVERFMKAYFAVAFQVQRALKFLIQKSEHAQQGLFKRLFAKNSKPLSSEFIIQDNRINIKNPMLLQTDLEHVMDLFAWVKKTGLGLHFEAKQLVEERIQDVNDDFRKHPHVQNAVQSMMSDYSHLGHMLFVMHDVHFFDALIPEFRKVRHQIQHDIYHVYTVDTHSIFAIEELTKLQTDSLYKEEFPEFYEALLEVDRKDLLSFGVLFHDIGKGRGGSHSVKGARLAQKILERFGYNEKDREVVEFLVISHLIMPHLSQRRDLEDYQMITEFANSVGSLERLNMLFILTWADIRAVSKEAWTDWKGRLLITLYQKAREVLLGRIKEEDLVKQRVDHFKTGIVERLKDTIDVDRLQEFLDLISSRYVLAHEDDEIEKHYFWLKAHQDDELFLEEEELEEEGLSLIYMYTWNNPRVMPIITGVLSALGVSLHSLESFMMKDGHLLVKMAVQSEGKESLRGSGQFEKLKTTIHNVFQGKAHIQDLLSKKKAPAFLQNKPVQQATASVKFDNDVSAYYTVIDVTAHDRLGLLYDVVSCLSDLGCYVELSKISTKVDQVVDSFYVKDIFGHKILSKAKLSEIRDVLMKLLD